MDNLDALRVNRDWAKLPLFDRSKWQRVRFGDVVENLNETGRNPHKSDIERFIGLEHFEPGLGRPWGRVRSFGNLNPTPFSSPGVRALYELRSRRIRMALFSNA